MFNKVVSHAISSNMPIYLCENVMCRLCGCTGNNISFLLLKEMCYLVKQIFDETKIKIKDNDIYPKTVCRPCVDKIHLIQHFRDQCRKTQKVLKSMFNNNTSLNSKLDVSVQNSNDETILDESEMIIEWLEDEYSDCISNNDLHKIPINNHQSNAKSKYGLVYGNAATFKNVQITLQNEKLPLGAKIISHKTLGQTKKERVQVYSQDELSELNNKKINSEIKFAANLSNEEKTKENDVELIEKEKVFIKLTENTSNGPLLYRLLTTNSEKDYKQNNSSVILKQIPTEKIRDKSITEIDSSINSKQIKTKNLLNTRKSRSSSSNQYVIKNSENQYGCSICERTFRFPFQAKLHVRKHVGDLPFSCKQCGKRFIADFYLTKHKKVHMKGQYICEVCGKNFRHLYYLKDHQRIHQDLSPTFKCPDCNKEFYTKGNFNAHKLIHSEKKHICEFCGKRFSVHAMMKRHRNRHGNYKFKCQFCLKLMKTKEDFMHHKKRHDKNGLYRCEICYFRFWTKKGLYMHEKLVHVNKKNASR